ncbi:rRNA 2'-O-methyltransferase fibrillarin-like [Salvia splendens]|uniref:rRNA 2'-O-methyltransferase fibrillarin-like n=1 Tax=Salvia splendens TaxID=180675 RepID=UPI001C265BBB|nr:rRNA 2'-O-methyltransferase fibrillarin-like [Salvia splendens]
MGTPETPTSDRVETGRGGGGRSGGGGRRSGGGGRRGGGVPGRRGAFYKMAESVAIARAWEAVKTDAIVGTDQTDVCFWKRVVTVYNGFKPVGSVERSHDQIRKKFSRITRALKRFTDIYENQLRSA